MECLLASRIDDGRSDPARETWVALVNPGPRVKAGTRMVFEGAGGPLHGEVLERGVQGRIVRLATEDGTPVRDAVHRLGHIPLPPYIKRADVPADRERYQTVYGQREGSIAAPTAGLHFTPELLAAIDRAGVERTSITLHVGYGTFQPVRVDLVADHRNLITAEVCPHHIALTDKSLAGYDTNFKMNPPLREQADIDALMEGIADGTITILASDHAPHCGYEKEVEFDAAPFGIVGLETELALFLDLLVHKKAAIDLRKLIELYTINPARLLRLDRGTLSAGAVADVTLIDPDREWTVDKTQFRSRSCNTPCP